MQCTQWSGWLVVLNLAGSRRHGQSRCEGPFLSSCRFLFRRTIEDISVMPIRMGHTMAARTDTQVDISERRPQCRRECVYHVYIYI